MTDEKKSLRTSSYDEAERSITQLIVHVLSTSESDRYAEVERVAKIGQAIVRSRGSRVIDFTGPADDFVTAGVGEYNGMIQPMRMPQLPDQAGITRDMLMSILPAAQANAEAQRARVASEEVEELKNLLAMQKISGKKTDKSISDRIKNLYGNIAARSTKTDDEEAK